MLSEKGIHILSCFVTGDLASPQQPHQQKQSGSFRKLFPFQVTVPVSMRDLRVSKLPNLTDSYRIKMQLQNVSGEVLHVQHVQLNLSNGKLYKQRDYATMMHTEDTNDEAAMLHMKPMQVQEIRKFFFDVLPKTDQEKALSNPENENAAGKQQAVDSHPLQTSKASNELGVIEIKWISSMSETGTLSTNLITKPLSVEGQQPIAPVGEPPLEIRLIPQPHPGTLQLVSERTCSLTYEFFNHSSSAMNLTLYFNLQQMFPMIIAGKTVNHLETLPPNSSLRHSIQVVPLRAGTQVLGHGISAYDASSTSTFYFGSCPANVSTNTQNVFAQCCLRNVLVLMPHSHLTRPSEDISLLRKSEEAHVEETEPNAHEIGEEEQTVKRASATAITTSEMSSSQLPLEQSMSHIGEDADDIDLLASMMQQTTKSSEETSESVQKDKDEGTTEDAGKVDSETREDNE
eukprot:CAMPEP_0117450562 /NCGR_PEP_ID=MMETSP0759-20121206/8534_1 /TAXON_ID=63605 /ORGANISM="Percolomonas cosmopolitus, Strain WS" /LENGTH=457 /DNA_ID=CAMNT_0005243091 /DNA_START=664 /DNA_END=2037 /DNA_ORIENTATION=+